MSGRENPIGGLPDETQADAICRAPNDKPYVSLCQPAHLYNRRQYQRTAFTSPIIFNKLINNIPKKNHNSHCPRLPEHQPQTMELGTFLFGHPVLINHGSFVTERAFQRVHDQALVQCPNTQKSSNQEMIKNMNVAFI